MSHLFERADFQFSLLDYDEAFVSPCTLNEANVGGCPGEWTPASIRLIALDPVRDDPPGQ